MLSQKYAGLADAAAKLGVRGFEMKEEGGKIKVKGVTTYQLEKDLFWDAIKKHAGWEGEVSADVRHEKEDIFGVWTVQPGDSLSKIAKSVYDNAGRYMDIFNANTDKLKDPNMIHPGQQLVIPKK